VARRIVGLDIGHTGVRGVAVKHGTSRGRPRTTVSAVGAAPVPPGSVVEGEVVDVDAVADAIKLAWSGTRLGKDVTLGVSGRHVIVRQMDLPWLDDKAFRLALPYRVASHLPFAAEDAVLDYVPIGEGPPGEGGVRTRRILLVAVTRESVTRAVRAAQKAGLHPVKVDLAGLALLRIGAIAPLADGSAEALVDLGAEVTTLVIHLGGVPRFVRVLSGEGGLKITKALMDRMSLTFDQAEDAKGMLGILAAPNRQESQEDWAIRAIIERITDGTVAAVRGSLDYFLANAPDVEGLGRVILSGGGAHMPGIVERFGDGLGIPVIGVDPLLGLRLKRRAARAAASLVPELATATGLSLAEVA
jgi:type IV pilus assembly protein PilM